jgi:hypothetical protein
MHAGVLGGADAGDRSAMPEDAEVVRPLGSACFVPLPVGMKSRLSTVICHKLSWN